MMRFEIYLLELGIKFSLYENVIYNYIVLAQQNNVLPQLHRVSLAQEPTQTDQKQQDPLITWAADTEQRRPV